MKLLFSPSSIHSKFFHQHQHPILINYGDCFRWAWIAHRLFGSELWSARSHAFIRHKGPFYDSEHLSGVRNWKSLRTIKEEKPGFRFITKQMAPREFQSLWSRFNKVNWEELNQQANNYIINQKP